MPWKICFDLTRPLGRVCFNIPVLIRKFPDEIGPWITKDVLDQKLVKDLPVLATIDLLASHLTDASVKRAVQSAIQSGVDQKALKANTQIEFR